MYTVLSIDDLLRDGILNTTSASIPCCSRRDTVTAISTSLFLAVIMFLGVNLRVAEAQGATARPDEPELTIGGRIWGTSGYSDRNIGAAGIERLSDLRWRGVDSVVSEVNFDGVWRRLVGLVAVGGGAIETGVLIDEDFAASGERIGRTRSSVDDSYLFYASADVGVRALTWTTRSSSVSGYVDFLLGYQYWQERYLAFGATGFPGTVPSDVKALLNEYEWHSLRVGARTRVPIYAGLSVAVRGYVVPWTFLVVEDVHYLRSDLKQDPSFRDEADGGIGWQADGAVRYAITPNLSVEAGFQYWKLKSAEGVDIAYTTEGAFRQRLREATSERYGPFVGVRWRF